MRRTIWTVMVVAALLGLAGCLSLEEMAPPVDQQVLGAAGGADIAALERGRKIYLGKCIKCHSVEPIGNYSLSQWHEIIPEMSDETNLTPAEQADLRAYVLAAHATLSSQGLAKQ